MKYNAQQLALIAAGALPTSEVVLLLATVSDDGIGGAAALTPEQIAAAAALAETEAAAQAAATAETDAAAAQAAQVAADTAAAIAAAATPNAVVAHLTTQLAESNNQLIAAKVEAASFKAAAEAQDGLMTIARVSLGNKLVALGGTAAAADTFTASTIVAEFNRVDALFKAQFKIGGVAAKVVDAPAKAVLDPVTAEYFKHSIQ